MMFVIGSGPAGISCAKALIERGESVTMLDAGIKLELNKQKILDKLYTTSNNNWSQKDINEIKGNMQANVKGVSTKYIYGSNYPYQQADKYINASYDGAICKPSFGQGGLSAVWGASVMPYLDSDFKEWPFKIKELQPYYIKVLNFMPLSLNEDSLLKQFPSYCKEPQPFHYSTQASSLLFDLNKNKKQLNNKGFYFGSSRLAVNFNFLNNHKPSSKGCIYCNLCMYGCPYKLIYDTSFTLKELINHPNFKYIKGIVVTKVEEKKDKILIFANSLESKKQIKFDANKVFLGCGSLATTKIMINSLKLKNKEIEMLDSQYFLIPIIRLKGVKNLSTERLHALAQLYIELMDKDFDKNSVHLQIYTYNDLYQNAMKKMFGPLYKPFSWFLNKMLGRMYILQGYLHSDSSSRFTVRLDDSDKMFVKIKENKNAKKKVYSLALKLVKNIRYFGLIPLIPLANIGRAGEGNHYGGSFPMKSYSQKTENNAIKSDILGRPMGLKRVHLVDSSVFPSICAQTITFTIMANAYRIGFEYDKFD